jgi:hypothetical protein
MNKEKTRKMFRWEGVKRELPWILFWVAVLFFSWTYWKDRQELEKITDSECYQDCRWYDAVEKVAKANPELQFTCDRETEVCTAHGVRRDIMPFNPYQVENFSLNGT